ncbi:MAG TPA: transaldolase [Polyangia bacterium]|jgi:transaldolase|nr:transaldolase [Polyangia bacterium]
MQKPTPLERIKIFADGASLPALLELAQNQMISGFTTNPTLMRKAGVKDYRAFAHEALGHIKQKPISFEVFADDFAEMNRQAREIAGWGDNVYVKIPITNTRRESAAGLVRELTAAGVKLNVTALCTLGQVHETAQALKGGAPSVISVFAGRIADTGRDPMPLMRAALEICAAADAQIELLWASPRELLNLVQAAEVGCHIITVTPDLLKKVELVGKDLGDFSLDTVKMFHRDAADAGYQL